MLGSSNLDFLANDDGAFDKGNFNKYETGCIGTPVLEDGTQGIFILFLACVPVHQMS
jgi:hypothetical protein